MGFVLFFFGFFLVQIANSCGCIARYAPLLIDNLLTKRKQIKTKLIFRTHLNLICKTINKKIE
ncbi:hypothetical protein HMPREF9296_0974 [Prevotella disiens FB035-09AN]|uniref:Uncharacterized protein n=1 Tax=Prevotella disiens FB035-09AN TaxID=866771 RepID=E1KQK7_9BACT|nr:hypothetical protein HMPREF9296_0974 [Prevotella disiens FB035-09AN]